jgi:hypothetical protein
MFRCLCTLLIHWGAARVFRSWGCWYSEPLYPSGADCPCSWCGRYIIVGAVCTLIGVIGYKMYGSDVMEEITLNLPNGVLATVATALIVVNPFTKVRRPPYFIPDCPACTPRTCYARGVIPKLRKIVARVQRMQRLCWACAMCTIRGRARRTGLCRPRQQG